MFHALGSFHPLLALGSVGLPTAPQPYLLTFLLRIWRQHSQNPHAESCYFPAHRSSKTPNIHTHIHIAVNATITRPEPASPEQADDMHGCTVVHPRCVGFQLLMGTLSDALRWPLWAHSPSTTREFLGVLQSISLCKTQSLEIRDSLLALPGDLSIPPLCTHLHPASPHVSSLVTSQPTDKYLSPSSWHTYWKCPSPAPPPCSICAVFT